MTTYKTNSFKTNIEKKIGNSLLIKIHKKNKRNNSVIFMVGGVLKGDFPKLFIEDIRKNNRIDELLEKTDIALLTAPLKRNLLHKTLPDMKEIKEIENELNDHSYTISPYSMIDWFTSGLLDLIREYSSIKIVAHSFSGLITPISLMKLYKKDAEVQKNIDKITLLGPYIFNPTINWGKLETINKLHKIQKKLAYFYPAVDRNFSSDTVKLLTELFELEDNNTGNRLKNAVLNIVVHPKDEYINTHNKFEALYVLMKKLGVSKTNAYFNEQKLKCNGTKQVHHSYHEMITDNRLAKKLLL
ncbi:MAG: hypothetical protein QXZ30_00120 [Candidatus Bilamarchaeaceae archaeon]